MRHPFLAQYDYYMKVDADLRFFATPPVNPFEKMATQQCVFGHTAIHATDPRVDCHHNATAAMYAWAAAQGVRPGSAAYDYCNHDYHAYYYGNAVIFNLALFRSPQFLAFNEFLYEEWLEGQFKYR